MPKQIFKCKFCDKEHLRYSSQARGKLFFCSFKCKGRYQEINLVGKNNPNYSIGQDYSLCTCGRDKDYRSLKCAICANKSYPKNIGDLPKHEEILFVIKSSFSKSEAATKLKRSRNFLSNYIILHNIDISHFKRQSKKNLSTEDEILCISAYRRNGVVKSYILKNDLLEYKCKECNIENIYNGKIITLQLDHINGNPLDNRLENLRFLCPNCHSQTPNYTGKKRN